MPEAQSLTIRWRGITIEVTFTPERFSAGKLHASDHIEVRSIEPPKAPIPVTETGYRSLFLPAGDVEEYGGVERYVLDWIEGSAKSLAWREYEANGNQLSLF